MDDPSMTMKEYIKFEEEKACKREKVFNWQTATYGKIKVDDVLHDLSFVEAEFPTIVINDAFAPHDTFQCKSQVSTPINDEFDFRISFDESGDEDYTIIYDTNSFSYKMIFVNDLKTDSENDYEKVMHTAALAKNDQLDSIKTWEDLKTKFLNKYCPPGRTAKKMEEINNFQQEPDETLYQAWERFKELLMKCPKHYLTEMQEVILFYNGLDVPTRQILDSRGVILTKTIADAKTSIQEMAEYSQKWYNGTSRGRSTKTSDALAMIQAQLNNLGREIKKVNEKVYAAQVGCGGYRATAPGYYQRNNVNPSFQERRQSMEDTLSKFMSESAKRHEENSNLIKEIRASIDAAIRNQGALIKTLEIQIGKMSKELALVLCLSRPTLKLRIKAKVAHTRPFLSTAHAKIDIYKRKITLRVEEEKIIFKSVKPTSSIIKRVYMLSLRERMELDLEARLMGETLVSNRSLNPFSEDYIELNDLNEPFELRRNQGDDLMPTNEEGEVIAKFRTRDEDLDTGIHDYPSYCDDDKKIHINFLEDMDANHDNEKGDIIFGEPFLKEVGIKTKWFEGIITLYNGDNENEEISEGNYPEYYDRNDGETQRDLEAFEAKSLKIIFLDDWEVDRYGKAP
ncbi:putative reverse transcriptase domain-containing protein [Tanacetum coccineum]